MKLIELDGQKSYVIRATGHESNEVKPANGTDFRLEEMKAIVGGYIEIVFSIKANEKYIMVVNEEGFLEGLPYNSVASLLAGMSICGDVLVCPRQAIK